MPLIFEQLPITISDKKKEELLNSWTVRNPRKDTLMYTINGKSIYTRLREKINEFDKKYVVDEKKKKLTKLVIELIFNKLRLCKYLEKEISKNINPVWIKYYEIYHKHYTTFRPSLTLFGVGGSGTGASTKQFVMFNVGDSTSGMTVLSFEHFAKTKLNVSNFVSFSHYSTVDAANISLLRPIEQDLEYNVSGKMVVEHFDKDESIITLPIHKVITHYVNIAKKVNLHGGAINLLVGTQLKYNSAETTSMEIENSKILFIEAYITFYIRPLTAIIRLPVCFSQWMKSLIYLFYIFYRHVRFTHSNIELNWKNEPEIYMIASEPLHAQTVPLPFSFKSQLDKLASIWSIPTPQTQLIKKALMPDIVSETIDKLMNNYLFEHITSIDYLMYNIKNMGTEENSEFVDNTTTRLDKEKNEWIKRYEIVKMN